MKILFIADIVGEPGRQVLKHRLPDLIKKEGPDFIIANAENSAGGKGLTGTIANELFEQGINVLTMGNHTFDRKEIQDIIEDRRILRPANYPPSVPGNGWNIYELPRSIKIAVINMMGRVYLPDIDCPFRKANELLEKISLETKNIFVDFHAEITSEKIAFGWFLDGRASAVIGTHTHVPTADERILDQGTAYLTDSGMTGPRDGIIGMDREIIIKKYLTGIPHHFVVAKGQTVIQGCIVAIDHITGKAISIKRYSVEG
ncbi:MAG: TIGR00282 family metallophosphoesterase [Elusimicrobia bacterium]|nr:TIGR00282 family metallophosphoesterase [Candidatus Liberimonas magnetica]